MTRVREFVAAQAREAALRVLASVPSQDRHPDDADLVRAEVDRGDWATQASALCTLAALAGPDDVPRLIEVLPGAGRAGDAQPVLTSIYALGGTDAARKLAGSEDENVAAAGARALAAEPATATDEIIALLYHRSSTVRRAAYDGLVSRLDDDALAGLLNDYPARPGHHFYDVIAALDLRVHAPKRAAH